LGMDLDQQLLPLLDPVVFAKHERYSAVLG